MPVVYSIYCDNCLILAMIAGECQWMDKNKNRVSLRRTSGKNNKYTTDIEGQGSDKGFAPINHRSLEK